MTVKMYSVFDSKTAVFTSPNCMLSDSAAVRSFSDSVNDSNPKNPWFLHPEDYSLFLVGEFDEDSGELIPQIPKNLVTASALKSLSEQMEIPFNGKKPVSVS